jgi:hypothetical protein
MSGQGDTTEQLAELRRQLTDLQASKSGLPRPAPEPYAADRASGAPGQRPQTR